MRTGALPSPKVLQLLKCPACDSDTLTLEATRHPALRCEACAMSYPIRDGILDLTVRDQPKKPGGYRAETLSNWIAGMYDLSAPLMSATIWNCSPLRYLDHTHKTLGRANGGILLSLPIATGSVLDYALAPYHDLTIIGIDSSRNMLKKAARRFRDSRHEVVLIRAEPDRIPLSTDSVDAVQSLNGLHTFDDRAAVVSEWRRVAKPDAHTSGATIVRGQELVADVVLDRYESYGLFPMLRTVEYLMTELENGGYSNLSFETHGAVAFFASQ